MGSPQSRSSNCSKEKKGRNSKENHSQLNNLQDNCLGLLETKSSASENEDSDQEIKDSGMQSKMQAFMEEIQQAEDEKEKREEEKAKRKEEREKAKIEPSEFLEIII